MNELAALVFDQDGDVMSARLSGEIDLSNSSDLERAIVDAVPNTARGMVLDLSELRYIDSAGVRLFLALADRFRWRGQRLRIAVPDDSRVRRVLLLAGAERALDLDETTEAAHERLGVSGG